MLTEAKKSFKEHKFKLLSMKNIDKLKIKFDIIFLIASFHHINSEQKRLDILKKIRHCLNNNGYVFFTNWNLLENNNFKKYESSFL
jgi:2-polyprenyl-3-methyl-5-hydroxy-6-metoxy-1,4-benzoquinol methylase